MSPTSFPTITPGEAWDTGPGTASTLMNQITGAINTLESSASPVPADYFVPGGSGYETIPRWAIGASALGLTSGVQVLTAVALPSGFSVGHITFASASSGAAGTPTHWWFTLHDSSRVMLAATADQTTTAWATNTAKTLAVANIASGAASSFTTTYAGLHYVGIMMAASSPINLAVSLGNSTINLLSPALTGQSDTGQVAPPSFPHTSTTLSNAFGIPYAYVAA